MPPFARREFSGNAVPTTITSTIAAGDLTINIALATGWPTGATGPFIVTLDQGLATEEKIEVGSRTGLVLTVTPTGRGHDGTAAVGHGSGNKIEHTMAARDLAEANAHNADITRDDHPQYLNPARHNAEQHAIDGSEINDASVGYTELVPGQRWEPGDFKHGIQTANHAGWLLCDGSTVTIAAQGPLWAAMGSAHIFGADPGSASFRLPDLRKKYLAGKAASGVGSTLGGTFGTADAVVATHSHTMANHSHSGTTGDHDRQHQHALEGHQHYINLPEVGDHRHMDDIGYNYAIRVGGAQNDYCQQGGQPGQGAGITYTGHNNAGGHGHDGWSDGVGIANGWQGANTGHLHPFSTGGPSNNTADAAGVSGTDQNLPPSIAVNGFIHS